MLTLFRRGDGEYMKTRETAITKFKDGVDDIAASRYLFASAKIFDLIAIINSSKILSEIFAYFTDGFDLYDALVKTFEVDGQNKIFNPPEDDATLIAFVYLLLNEINYKNIQLTDLLDYMDAGKNYELAYKNFANKLLIPFKNAVLEVAKKMISADGGFTSDERAAESTPANAQPVPEFNENALPPKSAAAESSAQTIPLPLKITRLIELDKLAINQSKLASDDKEELLYVLSTFKNYVDGGDPEKIKLSYLAYYYAFKPFKKIKNNLKAITDILYMNGVL